MNQLQGLYSAVLTPFDAQDNVNGAAMRALIERNIAEGVDGLFVGGSSAECFLLSEAERIHTFEIAAEFAGRTGLIAHCGALSTAGAIRYAKAAKALGIPYIAATPPFYYSYGPPALARYYYELSEAVGMPVMIYNFPENTGRRFDLFDPVIRELFRSDAVFGIKHTDPDIYQMERIRSLDDSLVIMNGYENNMLAGLAAGAHGNIGSTFNVLAPQFRKIYDLYRAGDHQEALRRQVEANHVMEVMFRFGLVPTTKYILSTMGIDPGRPRSPFAPLDEEARRQVDRALAEHLLRE